MTNRSLPSPFLLLCSCLLFAGVASAQWSDDPMQNLAVADAAGDQVQAKLAVRPGGGTYVSWFDNRSGGFDVYLQLLDDDGVAQWSGGGVLVADRGFSSTQDYGLSVDADGSALLAFRDDRSGGTQITAARVDALGALSWGANGVQLTSGSDFVAAPKIAGTSDGEIVVAWKNNAEAHLQRLDAAGAPVGGTVVISDAMGRDYSVSDLQPADSGAVVVSLVFQPSGFSGPKHLHAQKVSAAGAFLWGSTPLVVFDSGSLQFGNFPTFVADGSGGAAFSWYGTSPLQCYAQHVSAAGVESFPHNGSAVSNAPRDRSAPDVAYDPADGSTYVFWSELLPGPSPQYGIYGQRFDGTGAQQWGATGIVVDALSTSEVGQARVTSAPDGVIVGWVRTSAINVQGLLASRFDAAGVAQWSPAQPDVASTSSSKSRLAAVTAPGFALFGWSDGRAGNDDVYVQNVNFDGTLGAAAAGPGEVDGLRLDRGPGAAELTLSWPLSCSTGADYALFEGSLASLLSGVYDHAPLSCTDPAPPLEQILTAPAGDAYYLVVPLDASAEGSHGTRRDGATIFERPVGASRCVAAQLLGCP